MLPILGWSTPFSMPKAAGMQLLLRIRNSPGALALGARPSDDDSPRRAGPLYRLVRRLVNRSHQREKSEPGRLEQLPERKTKISHHMNLDVG